MAGLVGAHKGGRVLGPPAGLAHQLLHTGEVALAGENLRHLRLDLAPGIEKASKLAVRMHSGHFGYMIINLNTDVKDTISWGLHSGF